VRRVLVLCLRLLVLDASVLPCSGLFLSGAHALWMSLLCLLVFAFLPIIPRSVALLLFMLRLVDSCLVVYFILAVLDAALGYVDLS